MEPTEPPLAVRRANERQELDVEWRDGRQYGLPLVPLRAACGCARCVDEITGRRVYDIDDVPPDITIEELKLVGNYAMKIVWSDGHDTGLFTWELLRRLCEHQNPA